MQFEPMGVDHMKSFNYSPSLSFHFTHHSNSIRPVEKKQAILTFVEPECTSLLSSIALEMATFCPKGDIKLVLKDGRGGGGLDWLDSK